MCLLWYVLLEQRQISRTFHQCIQTHGLIIMSRMSALAPQRPFAQCNLVSSKTDSSSAITKRLIDSAGGWSSACLDRNKEQSMLSRWNCRHHRGNYCSSASSEKGNSEHLYIKDYFEEYLTSAADAVLHRSLHLSAALVSNISSRAPGLELFFLLDLGVFS